MIKKIFAIITAFSLVVLPITCLADGFVSIRESGIDLSGSNQTLDVFNNELFDVVGEISQEECEKMYIQYANDSALYPDYLFADNFHNDGLRIATEEIVDEVDGEVLANYFCDMDGNMVFSPGIRAMPSANATNPYTFDYNLGYVWEQIARMDIEANVWNKSCFTNVVTGQTYTFDKTSVGTIDNDGIILLSLDATGKTYKAQLKNPAIVTVYLDGGKIYFDRIPVIENGRTLVPLRAIFEKIGADVSWDEATRTVTASKDNTVISLTLDSIEASKNGESITLDVPAKEINGRTLVPVRFVADCFGIGVDWDENMQKVILTTQ